MPLIVECQTTAVAVECHTCGMRSVATQEAGNVVQRVRDFAVAHLDPHAVAIRMAANGLDLGWYEP